MKKAILLAGVLLASLSAMATRPWASVNELILIYNVDPQWQIFSTSRLRFGEDFDRFNMWFADLGAHYKFHKNFNIGAAYRYLEYRAPMKEWTHENRPMLQGHWFAKPADIGLRNRARFEFRHFESGREDIRFRNQFRAEFPWGIGGVKPYLEDEIFYSFDARKLNTNWLTGGVYFKPADKTKVRVAYRWNAVKKSTGNWVSANELYLALIQSF